MQSRARVAASLNSLIRRGVTSATKLEAAGHVTHSTLNRIRTQAVGSNIDQLDEISHALGLQSWQLMHPDPLWSLLSTDHINVLRSLALTLWELPRSELGIALSQMTLAVNLTKHRPVMGLPDFAPSTTEPDLIEQPDEPLPRHGGEPNTTPQRRRAKQTRAT